MRPSATFATRAAWARPIAPRAGAGHVERGDDQPVDDDRALRAARDVEVEDAAHEQRDRQQQSGLRQRQRDREQRLRADAVHELRRRAPGQRSQQLGDETGGGVEIAAASSVWHPTCAVSVAIVVRCACVAAGSVSRTSGTRRIHASSLASGSSRLSLPGTICGKTIATGVASVTTRTSKWSSTRARYFG